MQRCAPDAPLWPYPAATLRQGFTQILKVLQLPTTKAATTRPFDLGTMRPGGATWMLHQTESPEYVQRRGRWLSARVMEVYLQEVRGTTFSERIQPKRRFWIQLCSAQFAAVLERVIAFLDTGIAPKAWYALIIQNTCKCSDQGHWK